MTSTISRLQWLLRHAAGAAVFASVLTGCAASSTSALDAKFGDSVRAIRDSQIVGATAAQRQDPVLGIDGAAAVHTQDRYQESFKAPAKTFEVLGTGK